MSLVIDGTTIATSANVYVDGTAMSKVYIDGTLVWTKAAQQLTSVTWHPAWSGNLLIAPFYDIGGWDGSVDSVYDTFGFNDVSIALIHNQNGAFTNGAITTLINGVHNKLVQAEAMLLTDIYHTNGLVYQDTELNDNLSADTSSSTLTSNLPWEPVGPNGEEGAILDMPSAGATLVNQTARTMYHEDYYGDYVFYTYFVLTSLYAGTPNYT